MIALTPGSRSALTTNASANALLANEVVWIRGRISPRDEGTERCKCIGALPCLYPPFGLVIVDEHSARWMGREATPFECA